MRVIHCLNDKCELEPMKSNEQVGGGLDPSSTAYTISLPGSSKVGFKKRRKKKGQFGKGKKTIVLQKSKGIKKRSRKHKGRKKKKKKSKSKK